MKPKPRAKQPPDPKPRKQREPTDILLEKEELSLLQQAQAAAKGREDADADLYIEELLMELQAVPARSQLAGLPPVTDPADDKHFITDQVNWIRRTGETPLEFLTRMYRHPFVDRKDRISAAKAVQDYVHQKLPSVAVLRSEADPNATRAYTGIREKLTERLRGLAKGLGPGSQGPSKAGNAARGPKR